MAPTDFVFAAALVGRREVPERLSRLLNVESGLNDGLALPIVLVLLAVSGAGGHVTTGVLLQDVLLDVGLGVVVPWGIITLERVRSLQAIRVFEPLFAFSIGLLLYALTALTPANAFLAAFAGGVTIASLAPEVREDFYDFGHRLAELFKFAALLLFGALIAPNLFARFAWSGYLFAVLVLVAARPLAIGLALWRSGLKRSQRWAAAWFGPKGFASVVYALLVLKSGIDGAGRLFHLAALVITVSIVLHASTDALVARWFARRADEEGTAMEEIGASERRHDETQ